MIHMGNTSPVFLHKVCHDLYISYGLTFYIHQYDVNQKLRMIGVHSTTQWNIGLSREKPLQHSTASTPDILNPQQVQGQICSVTLRVLYLPELLTSTASTSTKQQ